jgi:hypothetical protein
MRIIHHLLHHYYDIPLDFVLNRGPADAARSLAAPSPALAADLYRLVNQLKAETFDPARGSVDYARVRASDTYAAYQRCARQLPAFDLRTLTTREEQLAFWINVYNALIVDAVIGFHVERSVSDLRGFFWRAAYSIGGWRFNANDIEHGVLRANAAHPAIPGAHFAARDPRRRFCLAHRDPRIHFALNCASQSCPPINFYAAEQIDRQLDLAARSFINGGGAEIDRGRGEVRLSQIFQWYAPDFGAGWLALRQRSALLTFIVDYVLNEDDRAFLQHGRPRVRFQAYDWSLNQAA